MFCKKAFQKNSQNSREISVLESLSNTVKCLQAVWLSTLLKREAHTGVSEPVVCGSFAKKVFLNNSQNSQENTCVGVFFK